jgi:hypothetical protein
MGHATVRLRLLPGLLVGLFACIVALAPMHGLLAAPMSQVESAEAEELLLGEYGFATVAADESRIYQVEIAEAATYIITAVDDAAAENFDLIITDEAGNELFNDIFASTELELAPGEITLEFIAVEDGELVFVVLGILGSMTASEEEPGKLALGNVYVEERVTGSRYAQLIVPPLPQPQQVLVYLEAAEGDVFDYSVTGEGINYLYAVSDETQLLSFWSQGGAYLIDVYPYERRSTFTLILFLGGEPKPITLDEPVEGSIPASVTEVLYVLTLDAPHTNITLELDSDVEDLSVSLRDKLAGASVDWSSWGESSLEVGTLQPGTYYVIVSGLVQAEATPFELLITGKAGKPLQTLRPGVAAGGLFEEGDVGQGFQIELTKPGAIVTVSIDSDAADTDFDLGVGMRPGDETWRSYSYGSQDVLSFMAPFAGVYYVNVLSNSGIGEFEILVEEGEEAPALMAGETLFGTVEGGAANVYRLVVEEEGQALTLFLVGPEGVDMDLRLTGYGSDGAQLAYASGTNFDSLEVVSVANLPTGMYEVVVQSYYGDGGDYFLATRLENPIVLAGQWAVDAEASSQYGDEGYSPLQATGAPDTPIAGDKPTAWASKDANAGEEELVLYYDVPVFPYRVDIYESYNPGAVVAVEAYHAESDQWVLLWEGDSTVEETPIRVFSPVLERVDFKTDTIRLILDTSIVSGWNEIDAVRLSGRP